MSSSPSKLRPIVVADDNPDDVFLVTRRMKSTGARNPIVSFFEVKDVIEYLEHALDSPSEEALPCVMFTDLKLAGGDGSDIIAWVRRHPRLSDMKLFVISGSANPADEKRAWELGADGFERKFPDPDFFIRVFREHCGTETGGA